MLADAVGMRIDSEAPAPARVPPAQPTGGRGPLRVSLLGPLTVYRGDLEARIGYGKSRTILGRMALEAGRPVAVSELVSLLWDVPPPSAAGVVQACVSRLRSALGGHHRERDSVLRRTLAGYRLDLSDDQLDVAVFRQRVADARHAAAPQQAMELLEKALGQWRGRPLADIPQLEVHPAVTALAEERIAATMLHAELAEFTGSPQRALVWLRPLTSQHPLYEPLHARLMTTLVASGLQADALEHFNRIRARLADELGIDPGSELIDLYRRILRQELPVGAPPSSARSDTVPAPSVSAQLPADIPSFTGRRAKLRELDRLLEAGDRSSAPVVVTISGTAGVGKTALALHWAHRVRERFPDGQLYLDLRGSMEEPDGMSPGQAIELILRSLHVPRERIPHTLAAQTMLLRSQMADRRMLIMLDNAVSADQVRPLLPGSPACLVLITSSQLLTSLVAEGAHAVQLRLLSTAESRDLLIHRLGEQRIAAERESVDDLITYCAHLPLALSVAAARAATQPDLPLAAVTTQLLAAEERLDALATGDARTDVRTVFSWSYRALAPEGARLFRYLATHPGPDASINALASLAGWPAGYLRSIVNDLVRANLLTEQVPGRYSCHALLLLYAQEQAHAVDDHTTRSAALLRVFGHYLHTAQAAALLINPTRQQISLPVPVAGTVVTDMADGNAAFAWMTAEHSVLLNTVRRAAETGHDEYVWRLAWMLADYLDRRGHWRDWMAVQTAAVAAARRLGDPDAEGRSGQMLARARTRLGDFAGARQDLAGVLALYQARGDTIGLAYTHIELGGTWSRANRHRQALGHALRALGLFQADGHAMGEADALNAAGWCHAQLGEHADAVVMCEQALDIYQRLGHPNGIAGAWDSLGCAQSRLGLHDVAVASLRRALELWQEAGNRFEIAATLANLGDAHHAAGHVEAARATWTTALAKLRDLGHPDVERVARSLRMLG